MRILQVINSMSMGGAEKLLLDICKKTANTQDVEVLILNGKGSPLLENLRSLNIPVHVFSKGKLSEYNPFLVFKFRKFMKGFDVIHVHLFPAQYWVALSKILFGTKSKLVTTEHNTWNTRFKYKLTTLTDRFVYSFYDAIVCISKAVEDVMRQRTKEKVRTVTINNGIEIEDYQNKTPIPRNKLGISTSDIMLLQVARFRTQKRQECVIRAMNYLPNNYHIFFVGSGKNLDNCKQIARAQNVQDRVHFLGTRNDVPQLWASADLGIMSSSWEGFGLSAVEGMAAGKPIIVSEVEGLAQIVGNADLTFTPNDERSLAEKIIYIMEDKNKYRMLSEYCRNRAKLFSIDITVQKYVELYQSLLS